MHDLEPSPVLTPAQWAAINEHRQRIDRSRRDRDPALGVGSAKELVESVARVALEARSVTLGSGATFAELVHRAHLVLERPAGEDLADDGASRMIVRQAKAAVTGLAELRNAVGTGHGTAARREAIDEHADIALDAAVMWSRWALRRLAKVVDGRYAELIGDLNGARAFSGGDLTKRLLAVNLPTVEPEEQRAIGVAVGRRAGRDTFTVRHEGIEVVEPSARWPIHYRLGLVEGLFVGEDGYIRSNHVAAACLPTLLADVDQHRDLFDAMSRDLTAAVSLGELSTSNNAGDRAAIALALRQGRDTPGTPVEVAVLLNTLANTFQPQW